MNSSHIFVIFYTSFSIVIPTLGAILQKILNYGPWQILDVYQKDKAHLSEYILDQVAGVMLSFLLMVNIHHNDPPATFK